MPLFPSAPKALLECPTGSLGSAERQTVMAAGVGQDKGGRGSADR